MTAGKLPAVDRVVLKRLAEAHRYGLTWSENDDGSGAEYGAYPSESEIRTLARGVLELLADNARIREYVDAVAQVSPDDLHRAIEHNEVIEAENAKLVRWCRDQAANANGNIRVWICTWCGEGGPTTDDKQSEAHAHDRSCAKNFHLTESNRLRKLVGESCEIADRWIGDATTIDRDRIVEILKESA